MFYKKCRISSVFGVKNRPYFQVLKIGLFSGLKNRPFLADPKNRPFLVVLKIGPILVVLKMGFHRTAFLTAPPKWWSCEIGIFWYILIFVICPKNGYIKNNYYLKKYLIFTNGCFFYICKIRHILKTV